MKAEIRYEPSKQSHLHRWVILNEDGSTALRFEYDSNLEGRIGTFYRTKPFWLTGGCQPWGVLQALASLVEDCQLSTWEGDPDEFLRSKYPTEGVGVIE